MTSRIVFGLLWLGLVVYAIGFAPPAPPDTLSLLQRLATAQVAGINPLIVALFNLMGIFPVIYLGLLLADGQGQRLPAWPFATGAFAVGAFAILPYLALRSPHPQWNGAKNRWLNWLDSRWFGLSVAIATLGLVLYGLTQGDWADFGQQWQTSRFIHVMSLDFCLLCALFPVLLKDDMARRGWGDRQSLFWAIALLPLIGSALYLVLRPPLPNAPASEQATRAANSTTQTFVGGLLLLGMMGWLAPPAYAQAKLPAGLNLGLEPSPQQTLLSRPNLDPSNIPSEKVSQFVNACLQVVKLIDRREGELQSAETETESRRIEQEIEAEALGLIEKAGLTRQEYLQLLGLANTDPEFGERVAVQLQEAAG
jgi:Domain of unknown function (DUF4168)